MATLVSDMPLTTEESKNGSDSANTAETLPPGLRPAAKTSPAPLLLRAAAETVTSMVMLVVLAWTCGVEKIPLGLPREPLEDSG
jgi:hypothetical protein